MTQKVILYKYRSLDNFRYFVDILIKNRLFAAKFTDLNDPMEGQYYYRNGELDEGTRGKILKDKSAIRVCSLSRVKDNELMWSRYANGEKGVAIGVSINQEEYNLIPIKYEGLTSMNNKNYHDQSAIKILTRKLEIWSYEEEQRVFTDGQDFVNVKIEEIITGRKICSKDLDLIRDLVNKINIEIPIIKANTFLQNQLLTGATI